MSRRGPKRDIQEAMGFAFDMGREEATRAREAMLVEMDRWLERGKILADVSDEALKAEIERRRWARIIQQEDAETAASLARQINEPLSPERRMELARLLANDGFLCGSDATNIIFDESGVMHAADPTQPAGFDRSAFTRDPADPDGGNGR